LRPLDSDATDETTELTKDKTDEAKPEKVEEEIIENVRISRKRFLEKKPVGGITLPVVGLLVRLRYVGKYFIERTS
jgi:hypothetical protein